MNYYLKLMLNMLLIFLLFGSIIMLSYMQGYDNAIQELRQDCLTCRCQCGEDSAQWYNTTEELTTNSLYYRLATK